MRSLSLVWMLTVVAEFVIISVSDAQTLPFVESGGSGSTAVDFEFRLDGTFIEKGIGASPTLSGSDLGAGTRLLWYPALSAFRAGTVTGTQWDLANIGQYSVAMGYNDQAGSNSIALGYINTVGSAAPGDASIAIGANNTVTDGYAFGSSNTATGGFGPSYAIGQTNTATGGFNLALGYSNTATMGGIALGQSNSALAFGASAIGQFNSATAQGATALGYSTTASAPLSVALGYIVNAAVYSSVAVGTYNVGVGSATTWVATDPLFEVGNGTSSHPSDALLLDKSGNLTVKTVTVTAAAGDIPMFTGN